MKRILLSALVALTAFGGVAAADSYRGRSTHHAQGGVTVSGSRGHYPRQVQRRGTYQHRGHYQQAPRYNYRGRYVSRPHVRVVRRPIYVQRPTIRYRYHNYYQRPAVLDENYAPMTGYYWVAGQWNWNGYEWIWMPGHYEPDPAYLDSYGY
jgi:hypothetical protein